MLIKSTAFHENMVDSCDQLHKLAKVYFGIDPDIVDTDVWLVAFRLICERFVGITSNDIAEAYKCAEIEKKAFVSITPTELVNPIKTYWHKKINLLGEINRQNRLENERKEFEHQKENYQGDTIALFRTCHAAGEWMGNPQQAWSLGKRGAGEKVDHRIKVVLAKAAKREFKMAGVLEEVSIAFPSQDKIYAQKLIMFICSRQTESPIL